MFLGREWPYFVKEHSDLKSKYTEDDNQHAIVSSRRHFRGLRGKGFQTDRRHCNGHQLCPSPSRHISVLKRSGIHTVFALGWKETASQFNFTYRYIDDVLSIKNPDFQNYLGQMYPTELEIKDTTESNTSASFLDLLLSIGRDGQLWSSLYDKRADFNFHITNFPFLSSNIPPSPAYGVLSHSSYGMPGLPPLMSVLFWERRDFLVSVSGRDMSGNVWNRPSGSSMVGMGISSNIMKSPSPKCYDILGHNHIQWHPPLIRHFT